jgi:hypothetical protein
MPRIHVSGPLPLKQINSRGRNKEEEDKSPRRVFEPGMFFIASLSQRDNKKHHWFEIQGNPSRPLKPALSYLVGVFMGGTTMPTLPRKPNNLNDSEENPNQLAPSGKLHIT